MDCSKLDVPLPWKQLWLPFTPRRSFPSTELLSVEISLDSDSQRTEGKQNGGAWCTGDVTSKTALHHAVSKHTYARQLTLPLLRVPCSKGLHSLHDGPVWILGVHPELQVFGEPQVQRVPGQYQCREQSCPLSQLEGAKETLPTSWQPLRILKKKNERKDFFLGQLNSYVALGRTPFTFTL